VNIHPNAVVSTKAEISANVKIGAFAVIEDNVFIDEDCEIGAHCVVKQFTRLGKRNRIAEHAVIGGLPQDVKFKDEKSFLEIGDDNWIREYVTLHRATGEGETTRIGARNFLMVGVHIAHNCTIGDDNIFANGVALAGHIEVENCAFLSSNVGCHQFVRIGKFAMVGGKSKIVQDVLPFFTTDGNPPEVHGLNTVGLRRHGFSEEQRANLKQAYRLLFRSHLALEKALPEMAKLQDENVNHLIEFIQTSKRGFTRE
jgi:UDP-N-acetylglucosamine acyltransferase